MFLKADLVALPDAFLLAFSGVVGGILPDIDLKYSHPSKIVFTTLAVIISLAWVFSSNAPLSVVELWIFGLLLFLFIRYPVWAAFDKFTVHRGSLHSIAAACMFGMGTVVLAFQCFNQAADVAWLTGVFVFIGCIFHLTLDEIYSVDFMDQRIKRSFGSAMKLVDMDRIVPSSVVILITFLAWIFTPPSGGLLQQLTEPEYHEKLFDNFLPNGIPDYLQSVISIGQNSRVKE